MFHIDDKALNQLEIANNSLQLFFSMETQLLPHGLEPWTSRVLAARSNQLSYESS